FRSNRKNLDRMLYSKGAALMESVLHDAENAVLAEREISEQLASRLADNARYALMLADRGAQAGRSLAAAAAENGLVRLEVYGPDGGLIATSDPRGSPGMLPASLDGLAAGDEPLIRLIQDPAGSGNELLAAAVRGGDGRAGVAYALSDELFALQRRLGIGLILDDLSAVEGVAYAVLQDTLGIIAASSDVVEIGSIGKDPFFPLAAGEIKGRRLDFFGEEVYELAALFQLGGESFGYLRVGLSTEEVRSIAELDRKRFGFGMAVLAVLAAVAVLLYFFRLRHLHLEQEHSRIKSFSDSVLESMGDAVIVADRDGRVLLVNRVAEKLCGTDRPPLPGRMLSEVAPGLAEKLGSLDTDEPLVLETELPRPGSAGPLPVLATASPLLVAGSRYTTVILRDLTDRKRAEELALRNEKYQVMAEVSASVAHEIRNPLNAIGMNVQRLKMEFTPQEGSRGEYEEFIEIIRREVERINGIVEQYLTLARFPGPKKEMARIDRLLADTLQFFAAELAGRRIAVKADIAPAGPFPFDPGQLRQVFTNLIKNAAEAIESEGTLLVAGRPLPGYYQVSVQDSGPGIPASVRDKVFEPFFSTKQSGLGLGLAIVQRIVAEHGGNISLESSGRPGTTFVVTLPADKEDKT
ncbi:MAG: PAS domain S-box protein, partial [Candidatus Glassbacteria bacterium]|nr:PAS domain S-box protein [Candidatus Glassbacteria bacterium]